ncbi:HPC2 [Candida pseudojiufengensis]|uniref:HPC2 n=1 Tax=Candida pseudojiufengensis TaxID=497109 RepID=UPI0022258F27|nr:HPC2 [Candida pseudojiufengensis]KAI5962363.1 HPC2 [Candida pseudojiufengensis]
MSSRNKNVSISSLLSSNTNDSDTNNLVKLQPKPPAPKVAKDPKELKQSSLKRLLSKYQTTFDAQETPEPIEQSSNSNTLLLKNRLVTNVTNSPSTNGSSKNHNRSRSISRSPSASLTSQIKKFQTSFQLGPITAPKPKSKTSINSIINNDDDDDLNRSHTPLTPSQSADILMNHNLIKRKNGSSTNDNKRRKVTNGELQQSPIITSKLKNDIVNVQPVKKGIHSGMTTEKSENKGPPVKLSAPTVIDLLNPEEDEEEVEVIETESEKPTTTTTPSKTSTSSNERKQLSLTDKQSATNKPETPIIALNIPLLDPKNPQPGKAEVVVNVLKLAEEKYGWSTIHPNAKSAIDIIDDMIDDEEDDDQVDDDNDDDDEKEKPTSHQQQQQKGKELTEEQLVRQHEIKMIRKVGKYDFEDPFIDDFELQMEEEISTTKEGFFVYWGPLIDDRTSSKKSSKKK